MAEVVRHEHIDRSDGSGLGFLIGSLIVAALLALLFLWALPQIRGGGGGGQTTTPGVNINVPQPQAQ